LAHSHGAALQASPAVAAAIAQLAEAVKAASSKITGERGPTSPEAKVEFEALMARAADVRGRALLYPYIGSGLGRGALVELVDGSVKWDMIGGIGVHFFGHSDPDIIAAGVRGALADTVNHGNLQANAEAFAFMETLSRLAQRGSRLKHVYCATSGCMANENAVKVCYQKHAPASRVLAFKDCFMGRSVTMSQIGDAAGNRVGIPLSTQVDYMPFYDPIAAERMGPGASGQKRYIDMSVNHLLSYIERYPKQHACFIFELIQGEGGFNVGTRDFHKALMDVCKANSIAVWDDEIQTFGRTERMFAYELFDLGEYVDVFCVGKMTQVCATMFTPEYNPGPGLLSGTFISGSTQFRTGLRVLERLEQGAWYGPQGQFARHHALFGRQCDALIARHPEWFPRMSGKYGPVSLSDGPLWGGNGGMMRFTPFGGDKDKVMKATKMLYEEGVISFYCGHGPYHVRLLPPLPVFDEADWPRVFACIERGLARAAQ
jgi:4-aminobutyrate aminotransferase-like enzyme